MTMNVCNFPTRQRLSPLLFLVASVTGLSGCDNLFPPSVSSICEKYPDICAGLNQDGWCRSEKANLIRHQYEHLKDTKERHKYNLLLKWEDYLVCVEKASQIQHIKYRDKETTRAEGALTAKTAIRRLTDDTRRSQDPFLSFYHWSRHGDEQARDRFLSLANQKRLNEPALLVALASMQIKNDPEETKWTLYEALSMYADEDDIDKEIFRTLINIGLQQENLRHVYVWYDVAKRYKVTEIDDNMMKNMFTGADLPFPVLDAVADEINSALSSSTFDAKKLKLAKL